MNYEFFGTLNQFGQAVYRQLALVDAAIGLDDSAFAQLVADDVLTGYSAVQVVQDIMDNLGTLISDDTKRERAANALGIFLFAVRLIPTGSLAAALKILA